MTQEVLAPANVMPWRAFSAHHQHGINNLAFDASGQLVATGDVEMRVELRRGEDTLWSTWVGTHQDKIRPTMRIRGIEFSPDGKFLHVAAADKLLALSVQDGSVVWRYQPPRSFGFLIVSPKSVAVSETGLVASGIDNARIGLWDANGGLQAMWRDADVQRQLAFLAGGNELVGCDSFAINVFDIRERRRIRRFRLEDRAYAMDVAKGAAFLVIRTLYHLVVMECEHGNVLMKALVRPGLPLVAIHPTRALIATSDEFGVKLLDFDGYPRGNLSVLPGAPISIAFTPDGSSLVVGCSDHRIQTTRLDQEVGALG